MNKVTATTQIKQISQPNTNILIKRDKLLQVRPRRPSGGGLEEGLVARTTKGLGGGLELRAQGRELQRGGWRWRVQCRENRRTETCGGRGLQTAETWGEPTVRPRQPARGGLEEGRAPDAWQARQERSGGWNGREGARDTEVGVW